MELDEAVSVPSTETLGAVLLQAKAGPQIAIIRGCNLQGPKGVRGQQSGLKEVTLDLGLAAQVI